jgi:hypothetical protein
MLWGTAGHLQSIFGPAVDWAHETTWFTFRFPSVEAFVGYFADNYGPTLKALAASGDHADALRSAFAGLVEKSNRLDAGGPVAVPATYLLSKGTILEQ